MNGLKWTPRVKQKLIDAIRIGKKSMNCGSSCIFFKLTETVGAKLYSDIKHRDKTAKLQSHASKYALGPLVGDVFDFECYYIKHDEDYSGKPDIWYHVVYGYLTQIAKVPDYINSQEHANIDNALYDIGISHSDICSNNVGYIKNRLVCIDFDVFSCSWKSGRKKICKENQKIGC